MKRILIKKISMALFYALLSLAVLSFPSARATGADQKKQAGHKFFAVIIDEASQKPVPAARIILAPKTKWKPECTIDTSLTGVSNERGEVQISNMATGKYVVFYNLSGNLNPGLKGKVVNYDPADRHGNMNAVARSLGPLVTFKGGHALAGDQLIIYGCSYASEADLFIICSKDGELLNVQVPTSAGSTPVKIEINTDYKK